MKPTKIRSQRGQLLMSPTQYGQSALGAPLLYFPAQCPTNEAGLVFAGMHGDETASISLLSAGLRSIEHANLHHHVILSANPDGNQLGLRSNANGVDLNRNFPTRNWSGNGTVYRWNSHAETRDVHLATGTSGGSEPETRHLMALIERLQPAFILSFHEPLACIDAGRHQTLGTKLAEVFNLPVMDGVGYDTPGSFGTWCDEQEIPNITIELPPIATDDVTEVYLQGILTLLTNDI
ncbi:murein tripeptide amidase MpaA [Vibrio zhugei]|uniref:Murein peptide amidase A n=1 Tax=Vibrio zhugei TaxID=2479546 RepID=A0ABV7CCD4_9VIBR|nr:murein tripeptide amidase MpaA [Vibrio zhugei]